MLLMYLMRVRGTKELRQVRMANGRATDVLQRNLQLVKKNYGFFKSIKNFLVWISFCNSKL